MLKNVGLRTKQMGSFLLVSMITVVVVLTGIVGLKSIRSSFQEVIRTAPLIDAAMEMKFAVARDMQMIMELLAAETSQDLGDIWKEHEAFVKDFDTFADAILNGAVTEEGRIYRTDDDRLRDIVNQADQFHNREFQPRIKTIYDTMKKKIDGQTYSEEALKTYDKEADAIGEKVLTIIGSIEDAARNSITGAQEKTAETASSQIRLLIVIGVGGVVLSLVLGFLITRAITGPVLSASSLAEAVAGGDLTREVAVRQNDEIGTLVRSLNAMSGNLRSMVGTIITEVTTLNNSSSSLSSVSEQIAANSRKTADKSNTVAAAAEEMSTNMSSIASATEQTTMNVQMIVSATEEMTATIQEIAANTAKGSEITRNAVKQAQEISLKVDELGTAASDINKVTETISDISEQTNLLALNATIEAARAGEAGKGFAVVAGEIKALADQTATATQEISSRIAGVQTTTRESIEAIERIVSVISQINDIVNTVASAIEEQSATTQEIANNVSQASQGIQEVSENINQISGVSAEITQTVSEVSQAAEETDAGNRQVNESSTELARIATDLNEMMSRFKI